MTTHNRCHLHFIVGPTATGKSALAFELAKTLNANILSADSRQVYQGLSITSGADIPPDFQQKNAPKNFTLVPSVFFESDRTKLFGMQMLQATEPWSVGLFQHYAHAILALTLAEGKNLIIVGGTGLYTQALLLNPDQLTIAPNQELRTELESLSLTKVQEKLLSINPYHPIQHNLSDWHNPRRLQRLIEIELTKQHTQPVDMTHLADQLSLDTQQLTIHWTGLTAPIEYLETRIRARIDQRIAQGAIHEVERLVNLYPDQKLPAFTTTGFKEISAYLSGQIETPELKNLWFTRERQYAKRQLTWFKKRQGIEWFDISQVSSADIQKHVSFI